MSNPLHPLPHDYLDLTTDGQRRARVVACTSWVPHWRAGRRTQAAASLIDGLRFFDTYYLTPDLDLDPPWEPGFYTNLYVPPAPFHYLIPLEHMLHAYLAFVAPRGSAKTTAIFKKLGAFKLLTRPGHSIVYASATNKLATRYGEDLRYLLYQNARISDDFSSEPEFSGRISPRVGEAAKGMENFRLSNRSELFVTSAESRQRGLRPTDYFLDDPEYDPDATTDMQNLRDWMEELIFKVAGPMVTTPGSALLYGGTFVSVRHYLWHVMKTRPVVVDGKTIEAAEDPRLDGWRRIVIPAAYSDPATGTLRSSWPHMWPANDAERTALNLHPQSKTLEDIERMMGAKVFASEMMARPDQTAGLHYPDLSSTQAERAYGWWFKPSTIDQHTLTAPHLSNTLICWYRGDDLIEMPLRTFCQRFGRVISLDTSYTNTAHSDFKVAHCTAITDHNELFSLDLWARRCNVEALVEAAFKMADTWKANSLHPETIREGKTLASSLRDVVRNRSFEIYGVSHVPAVIDFNPGMTAKTARIDAALYRRFTHHLIKLPIYRRGSQPYAMLFQQISGFNPHAPDGGLQHDDCIDTLAMGALVGFRAPPPDPEAADATPLSQIFDGKLASEDGTPNFSKVAVAMGGLDAPTISAILQSRRTNPTPSSEGV